MQNFDASYDMDKAAARRMENMQTNAASRAAVAAHQDERAAINRAFALAFDGDEDATAAKVADELGVTVRTVMNRDAYGDACSGASRDSLMEDYA